MKLNVQFYQEGRVVGPSLIIPANADSDDLFLLLKNLDPSLTEESFMFAINNRVVGGSVYKDCIEGTGISPENVISVDCIKTDVFSVRPVSRTSATLSGHQGPILSLQFSADGYLLASGSSDKTIRLWDTSTSTPLKCLSGHSGHVLALCWSPDDQYIASGDSNGIVKIWNRDGSLIASLQGHKKYITSLSWEPKLIDPKLISSSKDGTCRIWNVKRSVCEYCISHSDSVSCVNWVLADVILSGSHDRTIKVWSSSGSLSKSLKGHGHWINSLSTNMDHSKRLLSNNFVREKVKLAKILRFASSSDDFTLNLHSLDSESALRLVGHQGIVNHSSFSPDGRFLASASFDKSIKIWCGESGKFIGNLRGHVGPVYWLSWSSDSKLLISASKDSTAKLWDINTLKLKWDLPGHLDEVYCVDWAPSGELAASGGKDMKILIWRS